MTKPHIYLDRSGATGTIVLNRPEKRNAIGLAMWTALTDLLNEAEADDGIRVVVVRGVDDSAFAAGADIKEFESVHADPQTSRAYSAKVHEATERIARFPKPTIAMIQGPCIGGGCAIALGCDIRIADPTSRFAIPPAKLGLVYSLFDTKLLVDTVGPAKAKDMLYTGRRIMADEALAIGLIDRIAGPAEIESETRELCESICAGSQFTHRATKKIIRMILDGATEDTGETLKLFDDAFQGEDYREGTRAFMEKREPKFTWS
jgi:enoyl-CoA hydratase/carnithine racemase